MDCLRDANLSADELHSALDLIVRKLADLNGNDTFANLITPNLTTPDFDVPIEEVEEGSPVSGMNVFWLLIGLALACAFHPLANDLSHYPKLRRYLHASSLFCLVDASYLLYEWLWLAQSANISLSRSAQVVISYRMRSLQAPHENGNDDPNLADDAPAATPSVITKAMLDIRVRLVADLFNVILFTKLAGMTGIYLWAAVANVFAFSWMIMETFLLFGYHYLGNAPEAPVGEQYFALLNENRHVFLNLGLQFVHIEALILPTLTFFTAFNLSYTGIVETLFTPLDWVLDHTLAPAFELQFPYALMIPYFAAMGVMFIGLIICFVLFTFALLLSIGGPAALLVVAHDFLGGLAYRRLKAKYSISKTQFFVVYARILVGEFVLLGLVYFLWLFDSTGTRKSSWTEMLPKLRLT